MEGKPRAVVLHLGLTGYGIVKCLGHKGIPIIGVHNAKKPPLAQHSKYVEKSLVLSDNTQDVGTVASDDIVFDALINLGKESNGKDILFVASDYFVDFCSRQAQELSEYFHVPYSKKYNIHEIMYKERMAEVAEEVGLLVPKSIAIRREDLDITSKIRDIPLPVIVKPGNSLQGYKEFIGIEETQQALYNRIMQTLETCEDLIVSQYIRGPGKNMREVLGFFRSNGKPYITAVIKKLRQHPLLHMGSGTLESTCWEKDIVTMTKKFMEEIQMCGPIHIEFKREQGTNKPYFIEANYRVNSGVCISEAAGRNTPYLYYLDTIGEPLPVPEGHDGEVRWVEEFRDWKLVESGQISRKELFAGYKNLKIFSIYDPEDIEPFRVQLQRDPLDETIITETDIKSLI